MTETELTCEGCGRSPLGSSGVVIRIDEPLQCPRCKYIEANAITMTYHSKACYKRNTIWPIDWKHGIIFVENECNACGGGYFADYMVKITYTTGDMDH